MCPRDITSGILLTYRMSVGTKTRDGGWLVTELSLIKESQGQLFAGHCVLTSLNESVASFELALEE